MGECRTKLGNYEGGVDDEIRLLKNKVRILNGSQLPVSLFIWLEIFRAGLGSWEEHCPEPI